MANKRPLVLDDLGGGAGAMREAGDGECEALISSPYCTYLGTANTIALTVNDALGTPSSYVAGAQYRFRASLANTGAATINVAGLGAKTAVTVTGVALPAGYIRTDVDTVITYDASIDRFVVGRELERRSNANGTFTRRADGTQVCRVTNFGAGDVAVASGNIFISGSAESWTFPAVFAATPSVSAGVLGTTVRWVMGFSVAPTSTQFRQAASSASATAVGFNLVATGDWY